MKYSMITFAMGAVLLSAAGNGQQAAIPVSESGPSPNIIVIVIDDLRWDELAATGHPYIETPHIDRLAIEGGTLTSAFHAVPLCSPNRASILTGQYPSRHGIVDNVSRSLASHHLDTFPRALQSAGYETAFVGKWHMGNDPTPRRGFDFWAALPGQGRSMDPEIYENGSLQVVSGYTTDILTERAVSFVQRDRNRPFFLYIGHKAIHPDSIQLDDGSVDPNSQRGYVPAPRHEGRYREGVWPNRENVIESADDPRGKPALSRALGRKHSPQMLESFGEFFDFAHNQDIMRTRAEMLLAVDEGVGRILATLEAQGMIDHTVILLTSDNGYWFGEHNLSLERRLPYEEAIRMPMLIRYPALVEAGSEFPGLVSSVDIAPTVLDLAGADIGDHIQGRSFVPLLAGRTDGWRDTVLIEFYTYENPMPWLVDMDYRAVRTDRFKYIHWTHHPEENELYDLAEDPFEMSNRFTDPDYATVVANMRSRLQRETLHAMGLE